MTSEEIKKSVPMLEVVERYGFRPNRAGFIHCPFHQGDKGASLKLYKDSFHCFGCGENGDVFKFVMLMDKCDFKTAFLSLGGVYPHDSGSNGFRAKMARYKRQKERERKAAEEARRQSARELNKMLIDIYSDAVRRAPVYSDVWADSYNALQYQLYIHSVREKIPYESEVIIFDTARNRCHGSG